MKRISLLASLVGALALVFWLSNARPAAAGPICEDLQGNECFQEGQHVTCRWLERPPVWGNCYCISGTWYC